MERSRNTERKRRASDALHHLWEAFCVLLLILAVSFPVHAVGEQQCYRDQYVLRRSVVPAKRRMAVEALKDASTFHVELTEETASALLVEGGQALVDRRMRRASETTRKREKYSRTHLCEKVRRKQRAQRQSIRRGDGGGFVRRTICECNGVFQAHATPNDPYYSIQWAYEKSLVGGVNVDMNLPQAWNEYTGSRNTVVAVIDSGVDYTHPDLVGNMWVNQLEADGFPGLDDDGNGWVDDIHGINAINNTGNPMDDNGHGTHCAGSIGAVGNNGVGVSGVNWNVSVIGVKFLSSSGNGSLFDAAKAIDYVTNLKVNGGVNVVLSNNSWGGGSGYYVLRDAIVRANSAGILFVAAAGNDSTNNDVSPHYPSNYAVPNVISVAATDQNGNLAGFSNYGVTSVDIGAPGVRIGSTYPGNRYVYMDGTSMATPNLSGALALLYSRAPSLDAQGLMESLYRNGQPLASLNGAIRTGKLVDAYAMLYEVRNFPPPPPPGSTPPPTPTPSATPTPTPSQTPPPTPTPTPSATPEPGFFDIYGRVLSSDGYETMPVPQARVELTTEEGTVVRYSGGDGYYRFDDISGPIDYVLFTQKKGTNGRTIAGHLSRDQRLDVMLDSYARVISGVVVTSANTPISGVQVDAGPLGVRTTNADGVFQFTSRDVVNTGYELRLSHELYRFPVVEGEVVGSVVIRLVAAELR